MSLPIPLPPSFRGGFVDLPGRGRCEVIKCFVCNGTGVSLPKHHGGSPCSNCGGYGRNVYTAGMLERAIGIAEAQKLMDEARNRPPT